MARLSDLARRISGALEEQRKIRTRKVHIEEWDADFTLESLPLSKLEGLMNSPLPREQQARMVVYEAAPGLHSAARELLADGTIQDACDILRAFSLQEITSLLREVLALSGVGGKNRVVFSPEVEALKNA